MSHFSINCPSGNGSFYSCLVCGRVHFSPLLKPVEICLRCILDHRNRGILLREYGSTERGLLDLNTVKTQAQVAEEMGISRQRVQQIEISAFAKVRALLIKNAETYINIIMNSVAIAGRMVRDSKVLTSQKNGNPFLVGTVVTEEQGKDGQTYSTYWDFMGFGERNVDKADSLKDGVPVYATGRVQSDTYESKDGVTKAKLKIFGDIGVLNSVPPADPEEQPAF
jgi:hypothetical protein